VEDEPLEGQIFNVFTLRATGGSRASTTTEAGGRRSRQAASPRRWTGADQRRRVKRCAASPLSTPICYKRGSNRMRAKPDAAGSVQTRGRRELERGPEKHGAGAAVRPRPARLAHTDIRIGGWLVEPRGRHSLLAAAP
jgi:hypothetical protein